MINLSLLRYLTLGQDVNVGCDAFTSVHYIGPIYICHGSIWFTQSRNFWTTSCNSKQLSQLRYLYNFKSRSPGHRSKKEAITLLRLLFVYQGELNITSPTDLKFSNSSTRMSEFWKRKMRTFFLLFDFDKDRVISKEDWIAMAIRFSMFEKADKKKAEHLKDQFDNLWDQFMKTAVTTDKKRLTVEQFVDSMAKQFYNPELMQCISGVILGFFDQMDLNRDGYLQEDEHRRLFHQLGVPDTSFTKETFQTIDVNHDGKLSQDEFVYACYDFWFSQDEKSPFTLYFGPLVD